MATRVLVIEDNPANMELMSYLLQAYGHTLLQSVDGEDGVEVAERERPDLIICDVHLPKLDGYGVLKRLKSNSDLSAIPVVAVTALAMVGDREKILAAGFDAYIGKPIEPETFVSEVDKLLKADKRSSGKPRTYASKQNSAVALDARKARILVVDDSAINSELIRSTLAPFGYRLTTANTVQEGLELLRNGEYDLILSDLHLPVEDGFDFIRCIKQDPNLADTPFMFISASYGNADEIQRGLELGATRFIRRPIEPPVLLSHIETCLLGQEE